MRIISIALIALSLSACLYKLDTRQGNVLDPALIQSLSLGMSQTEVSELIGSPAIKDPFHQNRWDYVYYYRDTDGNEQRSNAVLQFEEGKLASIGNNVRKKTEALAE